MPEGTVAAPTVPLRIDAPRDQLAGLLSPAVGGAAATPVLFCAPWGWDEVSSYRARRDWSLRLAGAGSSVLRFDLPAVGDSTGDAAEEDLVARWVEAVDAAARRLDELTGGGGVAVLGLGLGGLLALAATGPDSPIAGLALWGTPADGRRFVREQRAFSRMQAWGVGREDGFEPGVPEGWLEAGGFLLSPATLEELGALAPAPDPRGRLHRVLAFDRDGIALDEKLLARLTEAGVEVASAPGAGWGEMFSHPETASLPDEVAARLEGWLDESPPAAPAGRAAVRTEPEIAPAAAIRERPLELEQEWGRAFAVTSGPAGAEAGTWAVFTNAGAVRHTGPTRLWVDLAREAARAGVASLRLDLQGIGEADGEPAGSVRDGAFNQARYARQLEGALDAAEQRGARSFVLVGLCAGAHNSFRIAHDRRVRTVVLINASALRWDDGLSVAREARKAGRLFDRRWLAKLLRGEVGLRRLLEVGRALIRQTLATVLGSRSRRGSGATAADPVEEDVERVLASGTRIVLAFSGEEPLGHELRESGVAQRFAESPGFVWRELPGSDHTLRPPAARQAASEMVMEEIARIVEAPETAQ